MRLIGLATTTLREYIVRVRTKSADNRTRHTRPLRRLDLLFRLNGHIRYIKYIKLGVCTGRLILDVAAIPRVSVATHCFRVRLQPLRAMLTQLRERIPYRWRSHLMRPHVFRRDILAARSGQYLREHVLRHVCTRVNIVAAVTGIGCREVWHQ